MGGLRIEEVTAVIDYYNACCTAEYILENCEPRPTEKEALKIGYLVRDLMNKRDAFSGDLEVECIDEVLRRPRLWKEGANGS
jgi:hypothetical protein